MAEIAVDSRKYQMVFTFVVLMQHYCVFAYYENSFPEIKFPCAGSSFHAANVQPTGCV